MHYHKLFFTMIFIIGFRECVDIEFYLDVPEIIRYWGYPVEIHNVTTVDGYILELHRIPYGRDNSSQPFSKPVIFLQHGFACSSFDWVPNLPHQSAAFVFADAGFDVWMGNFRGNTYSKKHKKLDPNLDKEFWNWSWDQLSEYDLTSMIEKVLEETGEEGIYYIGHSLGTLTMFAKLTESPTFSKHINGFFALAPIGSIHNIRGIFSFIGRHFGYDFEKFNENYGPNEFLGNSWLWKKIVKNTCGIFDTVLELCSDAIILFVGPLNQYWNQTRVPVYFSHTPAGSSSNLAAHFNQMFSYGGVPAFDMGFEKNLKAYGKKYPPQYDFSKIQNVSIYLFWSESDWLATKEDVNGFLLKNLKTVKGSFQVPDYNHLDFLWGTNAAIDVYLPIIRIIKNKLLRNKK